MKITLKKLSIYERMSEETTAFVADVYGDGKKIARADNNGHGGNTTVHLVDQSQRAAIEAALKPEVPAEYQSFMSGIEWAVDHAVEAARKAKEDARFAKALAKNDAFYKARAVKLGRSAARFEVPNPNGVQTRWIEFRHGDEEMTRGQMIEKYGPTVTGWTVIA